MSHISEQKGYAGDRPNMVFDDQPSEDVSMELALPLQSHGEPL